MLTEMFTLLKIGIQMMRNISVNSPKKMCKLKTDPPAVILPLIKNLYYASEAHSELDNDPLNKATTGVMNTKVHKIAKGHPNISSRDVLRDPLLLDHFQ